MLFLLLSALAFAVPDASAQGKRRIDYIELSGVGNGTKTATTEDIEEQRGIVHKTIITLTDFAVTVDDSDVGGGSALYTFPVGRILVLGGRATTITPTTTSTLTSTLNASKTLSTGVGTVQTTSQASGTLATTEQNIINAFSTTSSATINVAGTAGSGNSPSAPASYDGTSSAIVAYLNFGVPTATDIDGDATITVTGTITIYWINLGT